MARASFEAFCEDALAPLGQSPARHHRLLISKLQAVAEGTIDRLMVFMPPGSAKTTYTSVLFPPWFFARNERQDIIGTSYGQDYADRNSRKTQRIIQQMTATLGYGLRNEAVGEWETTNGGVYRSAGVGAGVTGRRADMLIIDDPIKGREDADSPNIREKVWDWYRAEAITRLKPGGRMVVVQTRWHEDDLSGRLVEQAKATGDNWDILSLPALAEENDALGRAPGEPLWPEWEDGPALARKRAIVGERDWASLFQQRPRPAEGSLFLVRNIDCIDTPPYMPGAVIARGWDLAATKQVGSNDPDWTVGIKMARLADGRYLILDVTRFRGGPSEVDRVIHTIAQQDGSSVRISLPQDPGQAGKAQALAFTRLLSGFQVSTSPETGDKSTRASPVASQVNGGNVAMVRAPWNASFLEELAAFPSGTKDDQVDALSRVFSMVGLGARPVLFSSASLGMLAR